MRILVTDKSTTVSALRDQVLNKKLDTGQADSAMATLQKLNPHVDLAKLTPGTVLFVPDAPDFQPTATASTFDDVLQDFQRLVKSALDTANARAKAADDAVSDETADVTRTFKSAAFKRVLAQDADLQNAVDDANAALKSEKQERDQAQATLANASKGAIAALRDLTQTLRAK
jgi:hypothetical protein